MNKGNRMPCCICGDPNPALQIIAYDLRTGFAGVSALCSLEGDRPACDHEDNYMATLDEALTQLNEVAAQFGIDPFIDLRGKV